MLTRRDFLRALGIGAATAAAPGIILVGEHEPIRKYYQVPAGAPVVQLDPHKALVESAVRSLILPQWRELSAVEAQEIMRASASAGILSTFKGSERLSMEMHAADDDVPLTRAQMEQIADGVRAGHIEMKPLTLGRSGSWLWYGGIGRLELHIAPELARDLPNPDAMLVGVDSAFRELHRRDHVLMNRDMRPHAPKELVC